MKSEGTAKHPEGNTNVCTKLRGNCCQDISRSATSVMLHGGASRKVRESPQAVEVIL